MNVFEALIVGQAVVFLIFILVAIELTREVRVVYRKVELPRAVAKTKPKEKTL